MSTPTPPPATEEQGFRTTLDARELPSAINSPELIAQHQAFTQGKVRTRFPPEPNGYLHIGHAKSMNMNFYLAFEKLEVAEGNRETVFRYDDTNPEAESQEYIDSLREDVEWMGWTPVQTTFTSDYFDQLYELAIKLIKEGKAYVCHQTGEEISKSREIAREKAAGNEEYKDKDPNSPWRDRPVEESLKLFEDMRVGKFKDNEATLRLKMDMTSTNFNMYDQVAYRIKFIPHPHAGDKWVIYPTYDYTHCIVDSLEHIDYSICTLEFESRRDSYYWVLQALDLYRPKVYEFSRLNITYTVLSKRKLLKLVNSKRVNGWDDPRMPTIKGLRRRGYTSEILNAFCLDIGVTRNENVIQYERLQYWARTMLNESAKRAMGVMDAVKVHITNLEAPMELEAPDIPFAPERGSHKITLTPTILIDAADFRQEDSKDYFGLAPGKSAILKYAFPIRIDEVILDAAGNVSELKATADKDNTGPKPKGAITWVPTNTDTHTHTHAIPTEFRLYNHLFTVETPGDDTWEQELNPHSLEVKSEGWVDVSVCVSVNGSGTAPTTTMPAPFTTFQLERQGYFTVDPDTTTEKLVLNRVVTLKESSVKKEVVSSGGLDAKAKNRKEEQARQLLEKEARKKLPPTEMFKIEGEKEKWSEWDEEGLPTKDAAGEVVSKSMSKKLKKEWEKQKKLYEGGK